MSRLRERIEKADRLTFVNTPGCKTATGSTWGSKKDRYTILFQKKEWEKTEVADEVIDTVVISTSCKRLNVGNGELDPMEDCKGNSFHTICYHSLGYLKFKLGERNKSISYYENILDALNGLNFGGQLTKIISKQGEGAVWAVVRDKPGILSSEDNINLIRGPKDDEGID